MRPKSPNRFLQHDLEKGAGDQGVGQSEDGIADIVEAADAGVDLTEEEGGDGDQGGEEAGRCWGEDGTEVGVGEIRVDDVAGSRKGYGEEAGASRLDGPELDGRE